MLLFLIGLFIGLVLGYIFGDYLESQTKRLYYYLGGK